jgi:uncharacterized C2H2 Zn-finger protein
MVHLCPSCNAVFAHQCSLDRHIEGHHTMMRYQCPKCTANYRRKADLAYHSAEVHSLYLIWHRPKFTYFPYVQHLMFLDNEGVLMEGRNPRYAPQGRRPSSTATSASQTSDNEMEPAVSAPRSQDNAATPPATSNSYGQNRNAPQGEPSSVPRPVATRPTTPRTEGFKRPNVKKTPRRRVTIADVNSTLHQILNNRQGPSSSIPSASASAQGNFANLESYSTASGSTTPSETHPAQRKRTAPRRPGKKAHTQPNPDFVARQTRPLGSLDELLAPKNPRTVVSEAHSTRTAGEIRRREIRRSEENRLLEDLLVSSDSSEEEGEVQDKRRGNED